MFCRLDIALPWSAGEFFVGAINIWLLRSHYSIGHLPQQLTATSLWAHFTFYTIAFRMSHEPLVPDRLQGP